ncbi:MAG: TlpA family protein disulfide reductase [Candidatus Planktophila sp.]|nr:TlpA family protein disulfide reductase [Candidatus Planktophila sp.]
MRRAVFLVLALLLSGCAQTQIVAQKGEVISCASVPSDSSVKSGTLVECVDGSKGLALESLRGPMIINVWGSWCASCLDEIPDFVSFYAKTKGQVALVGVAVEESSPENSKEFIVNNGITWPNYYDRDSKSRGYFGMGVPVTWFISSDGKVRYKKIGIIKSEAELITLTEKYLGIKI